jgi:GT2 family glycosyltransferase
VRTAETGSAGDVEGFATPDGLAFERGVGVLDCPYLVAVASDTELPTVPHSVMHTPRGIWYLEEICQRAEKRAEEARAEAMRVAGELAGATAEVDRRGEEIARLSDELAHAAAELERARDDQAALREIIESTTWRATRPLRDILTRYPKAARAARRSLRLAKWTLSGELRVRLRERRTQQAIWREAAELTRTGGIDPAWALANNPDVAKAGVNPARHYVAHGRAGGGNALPPPPDASTGSGVVAPATLPPVSDGKREWLAYVPMARRIADDRARRLREVRAAPAPMISLDGRDLEEVAAELDFPWEERPLVSIVVPVFNNLRLTLECLVSVRQHTDSRTPYEVIVADDASTDASGTLLSRIRNAVSIRNAENLGYLMNCNCAARLARGEFVLFLNNDVQVTQGWLAALVEAFSAHPKVGAVGPRIIFPSGHLQEAGAVVKPDCSTQLVGLNDDAGSPCYSFARRVDYCSGACLMLRRKTFAEVGGFSESLRPAYCEDLDLCLKLRERGLEIWYTPQSVVVHHLSRTADALGSSDRMRCIVANRQKIAERWQADVDEMNRVRLFAFYLPQFHPIPENDRWWGRGFTEWANVARGVPQYRDHWQPRLPADLGFYDLRRPEVMAEQADLAQRYGVEGFCFYYYWFGGKRLLEAPLEAMLVSGKPDFPFLLCWANENWTRRWDGMEDEIVISQSHSDEDDAAVIRDLMRYFRDPRYVRVNGRPMLLVYRVGLLPDFARTAAIWRRLCQSEGIGEIYLAMVASFEDAGKPRTPQALGCDAVVQFPPHGRGVPATLPPGLRSTKFIGSIFDYEGSALNYLRQPAPAAPYFPGVMPSWDNTARQMTQATVFNRATPGAFQAWLEEAIRRTCEHNTGDERIVFINAWNEWAEGAYLEPDRMFGHANLEAVRNAMLAHALNAE